MKSLYDFMDKIEILWYNLPVHKLSKSGVANDIWICKDKYK